MTDRPKKSGWILRLVLGLTALSLWAYIPYRYAVRPPAFEGFLGSLYALLFPLSALLALGALAVAWRPGVLERLEPMSLKAAGVFGGLWLLMGFLCVPHLTALTVRPRSWRAPGSGCSLRRSCRRTTVESPTARSPSRRGGS